MMYEIRPVVVQPPVWEVVSTVIPDLVVDNVGTLVTSAHRIPSEKPKLRPPKNDSKYTVLNGFGEHLVSRVPTQIKG